TELMGAETYLYIDCEGINMTARVAPRTSVISGDEIQIAIDPNRIHIFDKDTESIVVY
ncbi:MAG: TOBE domain-containing protein, partial [Oscillospiraceae bacterium]|nr:TOBE domain-containing protein [Oscillospiraceae bacterium]